MEISRVKVIANNISEEIQAILEKNGIVGSFNLSYSGDGFVRLSSKMLLFESLGDDRSDVTTEEIKNGKAPVNTMVLFERGVIGRVVQINPRRYVVHVENDNEHYKPSTLVTVPFKNAKSINS